MEEENTAPTIPSTLTIDRKTLTYLVTVYDAAMRLFEMTQDLCGDTLSTRSVVSEVLKVTDALRRICGDDLAVDWEDSVVRAVLDGDGSAAERADLRK